ncbi:MAG: glycosyltransferase family 4 protein, partial [Bacteroidota bacterium]
YTIKKYYDSFLPVDEDFVKVIFNGVETAPNHSEVFDFTQYIPSSEKKPLIILSTGRLAKQKGFSYLIDAAAGIIEEHPNVYFFLAGKGKQENELREKIVRKGMKKRFILLGFVEDIHSLLKGADIFVFSSLFEGMPNSLLEAMAHGLPVVSTNVNGVSELIENGKNGYVVPPRDASILQDALERLVKYPEQREAIGENAQKCVSEKFSIDHMVNKLDSFVQGKDF